ncbi:MAG: hypothetical protein LBJ48_05850 [Coriobacteriales bacterium]|jgi:hypothetical protein|nr:hypothetical protein [Coriobacteriales bacterium]
MAMWINVNEMKGQLNTSKNKMSAVGNHCSNRIIPAFTAIIDDRCLNGRGYDALRARFDAKDRLLAKAFKTYCDVMKSTLENNVAKINLYFPDGGYYNSDDITRQRNDLNRRLTKRTESLLNYVADGIADIGHSLSFGISPDSESSKLRKAISELDKRMRRLIDYNNATRGQFDEVESRQNNLVRGVLDLGSTRYNSTTGSFEGTRKDLGNWQADLAVDINTAAQRIKAINADTQAVKKQIEVNKQIEAAKNKSWFQNVCDWVGGGISSFVEHAGSALENIFTIGKATTLFLLDKVGDAIGLVEDGVEIIKAIADNGVFSWETLNAVWGTVTDIGKIVASPVVHFASVFVEEIRICVEAYLENPEAYGDIGDMLSAVGYGVTHPDKLMDAIIEGNGFGKAVEAWL